MPTLSSMSVQEGSEMQPGTQEETSAIQGLKSLHLLGSPSGPEGGKASSHPQEDSEFHSAESPDLEDEVCSPKNNLRTSCCGLHRTFPGSNGLNISYVLLLSPSAKNTYLKAVLCLALAFAYDSFEERWSELFES